MIDSSPTFLTRRRTASELDVPWYPEVDESDPNAPANVIADWQLYHYLSRGGIHAFANTSLRRFVLRRQKRFLRLCGVLFVLWVVFRFV